MGFLFKAKLEENLIFYVLIIRNSLFKFKINKIMKKHLTFSAFLLLSLFLLTGCGNSQSNTNQSTSSSSDVNKAEANVPGRNNRPDYGQPDREADVRGIVKTIVGNEVDVLKIDRPMGGRASSTNPNVGDNTNDRPAISLAGGTPGAGGPGGGGFRGPGGAGMAGGPGGAPDENSRTAMLATLKEMSTGEEKVIIPVGIKMLKSSTDGKSREMIEANLSDVINDKMITIWLNQSVTDKKVAEFVLIN
jgi:hypothetical protein